MPIEDVTQLFATEQLFQVLYVELRELAHHKLRGSPLTLLEDYGAGSRVLRADPASGNDRGPEIGASFLAYASRAMRSILVDHARQRLTARRGGGAPHLELDAAIDRPAEDQEVVRVHAALEELEARDPHLAQVVEMRYFAGLTEREIGEALGVLGSDGAARLAEGAAHSPSGDGVKVAGG